MRPDIFLATIGRGSNGSNALEVTEDRAAVTAESQDNIINRVNNISQYGPSWHYVPGIGVAGTAYAEVPGSALGDLAFSRASSKTRTNAAGVVETIGNNVPPHDYRNADGTLSTFPRLNLEPQRTNSIRNSSMVGAVAGTPGTLPTGWGEVLTGLTRTVVAVGTENGLPYIDLRFNGTATGTNASIRFETATAIVAANAQTWTLNSYAKFINQTAPPSSVNLTMLERTSGGSFVTSASSSNLSVTSSLSRFSFTRTLAGGATVGAVQPEISFILTNGATYDFTIRIAAPQMELGAYATTWVPTTTAAVTRIADAASKTGVSSLIGQTEGTIFWDINDLTGTTSTGNPDYGVRNTAFTNWIGITTNTFASPFRVVVRPTSGIAIDYTANITRAKAAVAWSSAGAVLFVNGVQVGTSAVNPNFSFDLIDMRGNNISYKTNQSALFPTRLTNAQLAELTTL